MAPLAEGTSRDHRVSHPSHVQLEYCLVLHQTEEHVRSPDSAVQHFLQGCGPGQIEKPPLESIQTRLGENSCKVTSLLKVSLKTELLPLCFLEPGGTERAQDFTHAQVIFLTPSN